MDQSDDGSPVSKSNNKQLAIVILDKTYMINIQTPLTALSA